MSSHRRHSVDRPEDQRDDAQRDRDRVLYTSSFRRLAGVTQVVAAAEGHVFHNRLTHTLEVAQIGRRLAEKLLKEKQGRELAAAVGGVHPEVVEAAALAHDLGHPPFGHAAEEELDELVTEAGLPDGFEGNPQSFRIVTWSAVRHEGSPGLNLTRPTLNAILKYPWFRQASGPAHRKYGAYHTEEEDFRWARELYPADERKSAEAELMDWADDIAYAIHDVEDFYRAGLIPLHRLANDERERQRFYDGVFRRWKDEGIRSGHSQLDLKKAFEGIVGWMPIQEPYEGTRSQRAALRSFTATLIGRYVGAIKLQVPKTQRERRVEINVEAEREIAILKELAWHYVIRSPSLASQQRGQRRVIHDLFEIHLDACRSKRAARRSILPVRYREQLKEMESTAATEEEREALCARIAADIVAGMTEEQALYMHQRLTGISPGSVLNPIVR